MTDAERADLAQTIETVAERLEREARALRTMVDWLRKPLGASPPA